MRGVRETSARPLAPPLFPFETLPLRRWFCGAIAACHVEPERAPMLKARCVFSLLVATLLVFAFACGGGNNNNGGASSSGGAEPSTLLEITSRNLVFDKDTLVAPAETEVTVLLHNEDVGVLHNVAFYRARNAREPIFVGPLFAGVETRESRFTTPEPGTYFFRCDVHPDTMTGDFIVR
jgi:plastocyanin